MKHRTVIATLCVIAMCVAVCSELPSLGGGSTDQQGDIEKEREAYYKIGEEAFAFVGTWACGEDVLEIGYGSWGVGEREVDIVGRSYRDYGITDSTVTELGPELELRGSGTWTLYDLKDWRINDVEKIVPLGENDIAYELRETIENSSTGPQFLVMTISDDGLYISKLRKIYYWYVVNELHSRVDEYTRVVE